MIKHIPTKTEPHYFCMNKNNTKYMMGLNKIFMIPISDNMFLSVSSKGLFWSKCVYHQLTINNTYIYIYVTHIIKLKITTIAISCFNYGIISQQSFDLIATNIYLYICIKCDDYTLHTIDLSRHYFH